MNTSNNEREFITTDKLIKEIELIDIIFKAQLNDIFKSEYYHYPHLSDGNGRTVKGCYLADLRLWSNIELMTMTKYKKEIINTIQTAIDSAFLRNSLKDIFRKAVSVRSFYNKNLTGEAKLVKEYFELDRLPLKECIEAQGAHRAIIHVSNLKIDAFHIGPHAKTYGSRYNYFVTNYQLALSIQKIIDFISKFDLGTEEFDKATVDNDLSRISERLNTFNFLTMEDVECYFRSALVQKRYLTEDQLQDYLRLAFELKQLPEEKFSFANGPKKQDIKTVFYTFYLEKGGKPNGKSESYGRLLSDYFNGYTWKGLKKNWGTHYKPKR